MITATLSVIAVLLAWIIGKYVAPVEVKHHTIEVPREDELYTTSKIAAKVPGLSPRDVRRDIEDGTLDAEKMGKTWVVRESDAERYMFGGR